MIKVAVRKGDIIDPTRRNIFFSPDTWARLKRYLLEKTGDTDRLRGMSVVTNRAVREFLEREGY